MNSYITQTKTCTECKKPFTRTTEIDANWKRKKVCGYACSKKRDERRRKERGRA